MFIVQNLMLKSFVIFFKYMISKVSCLVSARLSLGLVSYRSRRFWPRLQLWSKSKKILNFWPLIYRKPTFIGQYIPWDSFGPSKRKTNLIGTLVHRALKILSKN